MSADDAGHHAIEQTVIDGLVDETGQRGKLALSHPRRAMRCRYLRTEVGKKGRIA